MPGSNNNVAIDLICTHIRQKFDERSNKFRQKIAIPHRYLPSRSGESTPESRVEDLDLTILPQSRQVQVYGFFDTQFTISNDLSALQGIFTILRDRTCNRQEFVFFADRLSTLLVEHSLQHLPYSKKTVTTPVGVPSYGQKLDAQVCSYFPGI